MIATKENTSARVRAESIAPVMTTDEHIDPASNCFASPADRELGREKKECRDPKTSQKGPLELGF